jgi:Trm5-related predicted tRNA methylase
MDKKFIYFSDNEKTDIVKAKTPLKAAKKIWRKYKFDYNFVIFNEETNEKFTFNPNEWSYKGKFIK